MKQLEKFIKDCEYKLKANIPAYMNTMEVGWILMNLTAIKIEVEQKWIPVKKSNMFFHELKEQLKEGDLILTLDEKSNIIPYKFFLKGLNMIGEHNDNNNKITHWLRLPNFLML